MNLEIIRGQNFSSNSFLLGSKSETKIVIIDLGLSGNYNAFHLRKKLDEMSNSNKSMEIEVFLTHCHIDHILGYDNLETYSNVTFSASKNTAFHINEQDKVTLLELMNKAKIDFKVTKVYEDREQLKIGERELEVIYTPGHTDGCAVLYDKKGKSLFSGDVVFAEGASGRVDLPTGNQEKLVTTLGMLAELVIDNLYSGHGSDLHRNVRENILTAREMLKE